MFDALRVRKSAMVRGARIVSWAVLGVLLSQTQAFAVEPGAPDKLIQRMDAVNIQINTALSAKFRSETEFQKKDHGALVEFYGEREHAPVWVDENGLTEKARLVIREIRQADKYAMDPSDYDLPGENEVRDPSKLPAEWLAEKELKISFAALAYARHANGGRIDPMRLSKFLDRKPNLPEPLKFMNDFANSEQPDKYLADLHPHHPQFKLLLTALSEARGQNAPEEKIVIVPNGPTLKPGQKHPQVVLLRERLKVELPQALDGLPPVDPEVYDPDLADAVKAFQQEKGVKADAAVGNGTRTLLNATNKPANKVATLIANIERWRWMPDELGATHVRVNVPEFLLRVQINNEIAHTERVIVGKIVNQTPIFSDEMETVVLNPYWYPPASIIKNEILPAQRSNPGYIQKNGLQVISTRGGEVSPQEVDWFVAQPGEFSFRQPPGPGNVLGQVKFLFPNRHAVYMHDTPTKNLFEQPVRAYSHGCMRVRNPLKLAEVLLGMQGWNRTRINTQLGNPEEQHIPLGRKIPVHVMYFTAWADDDGKINYFNDLYSHDKRVLAALEGKPIPPDPVDPAEVRAREQEQVFRDEGFPEQQRGRPRGSNIFEQLFQF